MTARGTRARALALACASVVAVLAGAELVLRLAAPQSSTYTGRGLYGADDELGHVLRPNVTAGDIRTNSLGLRDRDYPPRRPGTYRILGLGDSHTFGSTDPGGIYLELLERRLETSAPLPVEVINAGVPGYSTLQELAQFRRLGPALQPDLALLGLFVTGDVIENRSDAFAVVQDGELTAEYVPRWRRWLFRWHVFRWLRSRALVRADGLLSEQFLAVEADRVQVCRIRPSRFIEEGFARTGQAVRRVHAAARAQGAGLLVLLIPDEAQVDPGVFRRAVERRRDRLDDYDPDAPNRRLSAMLRGSEIGFLDLLPALRARHAASPLYRPLDTHWNEDGHALAADLLHEQVLSHVRTFAKRGAAQR